MRPRPSRPSSRAATSSRPRARRGVAWSTRLATRCWPSSQCGRALQARSRCEDRRSQHRASAGAAHAVPHRLRPDHPRSGRSFNLGPRPRTASSYPPSGPSSPHIGRMLHKIPFSTMAPTLAKIPPVGDNWITKSSSTAGARKSRRGRHDRDLQQERHRPHGTFSCLHTD